MNDVIKYIDSQSEDIKPKLLALRKFILDADPEIGEKFAWGMPTFTLNGNLIHFAACKNHIGIYPCPSAIEKFKDEISVYKSSKGAFQIPYKDELPFDLLEKILKFRIDEQKGRVK